ncbi:Gag-pol polyprotein-like protein [Theobroma cacao]|uniref:Gag-pol polyprotein-like protein n=1 Tax=Theobroma cacao TaxID=3641 RepID=A0A061EUE4_THECC|nr:Gag-pol polyprotein-like protein [Theobroma cacao]
MLHWFSTLPRLVIHFSEVFNLPTIGVFYNAQVSLQRLDISLVSEREDYYSLHRFRFAVEFQYSLFGSSDEENDTNLFHQNSSSNEEVPIRRLRTAAARDLGIKVNILEFEGRLHPDDFLDWLYTVEKVFELKDIPDEKRVKLVAIKLKKHASIWWESLKRQREREGRNKIRTWDKMRRELKQYTMEFEQLHQKCDVHEPKEQTVARYLRGLNVEIADVVQLQPYWNLNDVIRLALKVEKQRSRKRSMRSSRQQESTSNNGSQSSITIPPPKVNSSKTASNNDKETTCETLSSSIKRRYCTEWYN